MKQIINMTFLILVSGLVLLSCSKQEEQSTQDMMMNMKKQNEIMDIIAKDPEMMNNMMDHMMANNDAMIMMKGNPKMLKQMIENDSVEPMMMQDHDMMKGIMGHMMNIMQGDSVVCMEMENMMMNNEHMMGSVMDMATRHTNKMMDEEKMSRHMH